MPFVQTLIKLLFWGHIQSLVNSRIVHIMIQTSDITKTVESDENKGIF